MRNGRSTTTGSGENATAQTKTAFPHARTNRDPLSYWNLIMYSRLLSTVYITASTEFTRVKSSPSGVAIGGATMYLSSRVWVTDRKTCPCFTTREGNV